MLYNSSSLKPTNHLKRNLAKELNPHSLHEWLLDGALHTLTFLSGLEIQDDHYCRKKLSIEKMFKDLLL
jgi:hypothetical protein